MTTSHSLRVSRFTFSLALSATIASCADSDSTSHAPDLGEVRQELFANDKTIYEYFVGKGLKSYQAAGIVGNLDQESGGDPKAVQPGGPGRGIAQWSVGGRWDKDAGDNEKAFAAKEGKSTCRSMCSSTSSGSSSPRSPATGSRSSRPRAT